MQQATGQQLQSQKRARAARIPFRELGGQTAVFAAAFLFAQTQALGNVSPFAFAFTCAAPQGYTVMAGAGACVGYALRLDEPVHLLRYLVCTVAAVLLRLFCFRFFKTTRSAVLAPAIAVACSLATGGTVLLSLGLDLGGVLQFGSDSILCGAMAWFAHYALKALARGRAVLYAGKKELTGLGICCCVLLLCAAELQFWNVTPAHVVGGVAVLCAAMLGGVSGGSVAGVCVGFALAAAHPLGCICVVFCLGGVLAGLCKPVGQLGVAVLFSLVAGITALLDGSPQAVALLFETAAAAVLFVALPKSWFAGVHAMLHPQGTQAVANHTPVKNRLELAAAAMQEVSTCIETVAKGLDKANEQEEDVAIMQLYNRICKDCKHKQTCWVQYHSQTQQSMQQVLDTMHQKGYISALDFAVAMQDGCTKTQELAEALNHLYVQRIIRCQAKARTQQMRELVEEQFSSMSQVLTDLADNLREEETLLPGTAKRVRHVLEQAGLPCFSVQFRRDACGRATLVAETARAEGHLRETQLLQNLQTAAGVALARPQTQEIPQGVRLTFHQAQTLRLDVGVAQLPHNDALICGDYYQTFTDDTGREVLLLSDGMGTGSRAAVDSAMAAELFSKLAMANLSYPCALRITNAAMLVKSTDESLATLDVASIDKCTGKTQVYKAGAATSFVRHKKKVTCLEYASMPVGILREIRFSGCTFTLEPGDLLVLVSDGVVADGTKEFADYLRRAQADDAQTLAQELVDLVSEKQNPKTRDDITVMVARVEKAY